MIAKTGTTPTRRLAVYARDVRVEEIMSSDLRWFRHTLLTAASAGDIERPEVVRQLRHY